MTAKTTTERQQALKAKRKAEGLVRLELWVKPEHKELIKLYALKLSNKRIKEDERKALGLLSDGFLKEMEGAAQRWAKQFHKETEQR
jgi:hypothetical protein